jgi:hypothetical protein
MSTGCYRPESDCIMHSYNGSNTGKLVQFCRICGEEMVLNAYQVVNPIDSAFPPAGAMNMSQADRKEFRVKTVGTASLAVAWALDGKPLAGSAPGALTLSDLAPGSHRLAVTVRDTTPEVRKDQRVLADTAEWAIQVSPITATRRLPTGGGVAAMAYTARGLSLDLSRSSRVTISRLDLAGRSRMVLASGEYLPAGRAYWPIAAGPGVLSITVGPANGQGPVFHRLLPGISPASAASSAR